MSSDYGRATGQPRKVVLAGVEYSVPKLTPSILGELDTWLKDRVPNPLLEAREHLLAMRDLPLEIQKHIWDCALLEKASWPPRNDSAKGNELLFTSFDGLRQFLYVLLKRTTEGMTLDRAGEIVDSLTDGGDEVQRLLEIVGPGEVGDPKAPESATTETTPASA